MLLLLLSTQTGVVIVPVWPLGLARLPPIVLLRSVGHADGSVRVNDRILNAAGVLRPPELRSLDAIHLATAQQLGEELSALVTYDDRMVTAAKQLGYRIVQPR